MFSFLSIKDGVYIALILALIGGAYWKLQDWHYRPLKEKDNIITIQTNTIIMQDANISTLEAEKEKIISDMSVVYDDGYRTGWKGGYEYEKSNTASIHSTSFPF